MPTSLLLSALNPAERPIVRSRRLNSGERCRRLGVMQRGTLVLVLAANFYAATLAGGLRALRLAEPSLRWSVAQASSAGANSPGVADVQKTFAEGEAALQRGELETAEAAFRKVLSADPRAGAAYANLGVIAMRRKDWDHALSLLQKAERLEPQMDGIRLVIGSGQFRQCEQRRTNGAVADRV